MIRSNIFKYKYMCLKSRIIIICIILKDMTFIKNLSFFPYATWWRLEGQADIKNTCGGITTLIIFGIIGAIFTLKLKDVFQRVNITVAQIVEISSYTPNATLTTIQNDPTRNPFMFAVDPQSYNPTSDKLQLNPENFKFIAQYSPRDLKELIIFQKCTYNHFSTSSNLKSHLDSLDFTKWLCFPINKTWVIGGDEFFYNTTEIKINILCQTQSCKANNESVYFNSVILNGVANPYNKQTPMTFSMSNVPIYFMPFQQFKINVRLDQNQIITDKSVIPQADYSYAKGYSFGENLPTVTIASTASLCTVNIHRSKFTYTYKRSYQKILDAVSYIGGIFQTMLGLCFFLAFFNTNHFEMRFAAEFFGCKPARNFQFLTFIKQSVYELLYKTRFQPQWEHAQARRQVKAAVNHIQDIFFLNRRIQFLEKAISVLLQKHQLKGVRLLQNMSQNDVMEDYKSQKYRKKMLLFLKKHQRMAIQTSNSVRILNGKSKIQLGRQLNPTIIENQDKEQKRYRSKRSIQKDNKKDNKQTKMKTNKEINPIYTSKQLITHPDNTQQLMNLQKEDQIFDQIDQADQNEQQQNKENEENLIREIQGDLRRLVLEAEKPMGDRRSKKIYQKIEEKLRLKLKAAITQFEGERYQQFQRPIKRLFEME